MFLVRQSIKFSGWKTGIRFISTAPKEQELTVWWDSECPLCTREINLMKSLDSQKAINFVALSKGSPFPENIKSASGCPLTKKELLARFHAQENGGEVVSGARAFAAMWKRMPQKQLQWVGRTAERSPLFMSLLERSYRGFLVVRPFLQRFAKKVEGSKGK